MLSRLERAALGDSNIMQQVFDALAAAPQLGFTPDEIAIRTSLPPGRVAGALHRLRKLRRLASTCIDGVWRYRLRVGAERP